MSVLANSTNLTNSTDNVEMTDSLEKDGKTSYDCSEEKYVMVDGKYHYTDRVTNTEYYFNDKSETWVVVEKDSNAESSLSDKGANHVLSEGSYSVDEEGRTYYYADGRHLCRYRTGEVFYLNENSEWILWEQSGLESSESKSSEVSSHSEKWYFYKGDNCYYRDHATNKIFRLDKSKNEWIEQKRKRKKSEPKDSVEEFDSDSSDGSDTLSDFEEDDQVKIGVAPPGYKNDPNISFDGNMYTKKDKDGMLYEWNVLRRAWFPKLDDTFMAQYQLNYGFNPDGTKDENPVKYDDEEDEDVEVKTSEKDNQKINEKKDKKISGWFEADDAHNNKVYVSNLPLDYTEEQFVDLMQKCGLVLKELDTNKFKIKFYKDEQGAFKGDALCTYIKVESVDLALQILDGATVESGSKTDARVHKKISVERAKFSLKGEYNSSLRPKKKSKKLRQQMQRKQEKLFAWHLEPLRGQRSKNESVVIIRNAFDPCDFENNAELVLAHSDALRAQCATFGTIKKLELFDRHKEGVVKVAFVDVEAADVCISSMHDRLYNNRRLAVACWDGSESFKVEESEEERKKRLKNWDKFLQQKVN